MGLAEYARALTTLGESWPLTHFVLCNPVTKAPVSKTWRTRPSLGAVWNHCRSGGAVGLIPSTLGFTAVDVDKGSPMCLSSAAWPSLITPTRSPGHAHLWYVDDTPRSNSKWAWFQLSGEIRSGAGYVILWGEEAPRGLLNRIDPEGVYYGEVEDLLKPEDGRKEVHNPQGGTQLPMESAPLGGRVITDPGAVDRYEYALQNLSRYSPDPYEDWIAVGMALHQAAVQGELTDQTAFALWSGWSSKSAKYKPSNQAVHWKSFGSYQGSRITPASLFG